MRVTLHDPQGAHPKQATNNTNDSHINTIFTITVGKQIKIK
jgi:hypothetical protein